MSKAKKEAVEKKAKEKKAKFTVREDGVHVQPTKILCDKCQSAMQFFFDPAKPAAWRECTACDFVWHSPKYMPKAEKAPREKKERKATIARKKSADEIPVLKRGPEPKNKAQRRERIQEVLETYAGQRCTMGDIARALIARGIENSKQMMQYMRKQLLDRETILVEIGR